MQQCQAERVSHRGPSCGRLASHHSTTRMSSKLHTASRQRIRWCVPWRHGSQPLSTQMCRTCCTTSGRSASRFRRKLIGHSRVSALRASPTNAVTFLARYILWRHLRGKVSRAWLGVDASHRASDLLQTPPTDPCPCGSGRRFGNCCSAKIGRAADLERRAPLHGARARVARAGTAHDPSIASVPRLPG